MQTIEILKQQKTREGSLAEQKWKLICKFNNKSVDELKKAMEKAKIPAARRGLSWHVRREYIKLVEVKDPKGDAPAAEQPAKD